MFALKTDYRELIYKIIEMLFKNEKAIIMLIPHVFPPVGYEVESDPDACLKVYQKLRQVYPDRIFIVKGEYNHNEIKYVIGKCVFFIGSRMHSCIAAMSQYVPTIGIAYSRKFQGVFESIGLRECVVDGRRLDKEMLLHAVEEIFEKRDEIENHLRTNMPKIQKDILNLFHTWHGNQQSSYI